MAVAALLLSLLVEMRLCHRHLLCKAPEADRVREAGLETDFRGQALRLYRHHLRCQVQDRARDRECAAADRWQQAALTLCLHPHPSQVGAEEPETPRVELEADWDRSGGAGAQSFRHLRQLREPGMAMAGGAASDLWARVVETL
jgi:hypothetical protein